MRRRAALAVALQLLALVPPAVLASGVSSPALKAGVFEPPRQAPDFSLQGSDGRELRLSGHRGKLVLLGFGFTHCPEVCPTTLAVLAQARKALGPDAAGVQVLFVTVDPERDSAERMRQYLSAFDPSFLGGSGTPAQLAAVRKSYGVVAEKVATTHSYGIDHSTFVYLVDREGKLRGQMPYGRPAADYVHDVKLLLRK